MRLLRTIGLGVLLAGGGAGGIAWADVQATLASPIPRATLTIIDGRVWRCEGAICRGMDTDATQSQPEARACARAAAELGAFTAYATDGTPLPAEKLDACNKRARPANKAG